MERFATMEALENVQDYFWDFAEDRLPPAIFDTLYSFSGHLVTVFQGLNNVITYAYKSASGTQGIPTLTSLEQILPPLLSIIAIYFGFLSIYRTTTSLIRTAIGIVKWVSIISLVAMGAGYFIAQGPLDAGMLLRIATELTNGQQRVTTHTGAGDDGSGTTDAGTGAGQQTYGGRTRTQRGERGEREGRRPGVFDSFLNHQEWKESQNQAEDTQKYVQQVVEGAQKAYKDGSGFLDLLFKRSPSSERDRTASENPDDNDTQRRQTRSQTRRARRDKNL